MKACVFSKKDYYSPDGMLTAVWGPNMWHFLHTMSFNYPIKPTNKDKRNYMKFIKSLQHVLPCRYCRDNFKNNLTTINFNMGVMKNRDTFSRWIYKLHNLVNKRLGKKNTLSYCEVRDRYEHFRARCLNKYNTKTQGGGGKKSKKRRRRTGTSVRSKKQKGGRNIEKGCTDSLYGLKSMSVINIIPKKKGIKTLKISPKCRIKKM